MPSLPGCISEGDTLEEALKNIREAITLYIESMEAHGEPVPEDQPIEALMGLGCYEISVNGIKQA